MSLTKIDKDQLKNFTILDSDVDANADIAQSKIHNLTSDLAAINTALNGKLDLSGGEVTGTLVIDGLVTLSGGAVAPTGQVITLTDAPVNGTDAANKDYADAQGAAAISYANGTFLSLGGGTLTGSLVLPSDAPSQGQGFIAASRDYVLSQVQSFLSTDIFTGLNLSYIDASNISVAAGECLSDDSILITLSTATTLNTGVNGAGGLDSGTVTPGNWYGVWAIFDSTNNVSNVICSLDSGSLTLPGTYDKKRRIGSFYIDSSSNISPFTQKGTSSIKVTHITPLDLTGQPDGDINLYTLNKAPSTTDEVLIDIAVDNTSTAPLPITVSEKVGGTYVLRKTTYGTGNAGEFEVRLNSGILNITGGTNSAPAHIPIINLVGYTERL